MALVTAFVAIAAIGTGPRATHAAEAKPAWQVEWEKVLAAAKKEGQVAVYISGYEEILPDFQKEYPEIKVAAITGPRLPGRPAFARGAARRKISCRRGERRWGDDLSAVVSRQGFRSDQAGAAAAGDQRHFEVVSRQASLRRSGKSIHFQLRRHRDLWLDQLQHQVGQCEGF